jgi:hypothetical protein
MLLEIGHDVSDRRGREIEARASRNGHRPDRLSRDDVGLDERLQDIPLPGIELVVVREHGSPREKSAAHREAAAPGAFLV